MDGRVRGVLRLLRGLKLRLLCELVMRLWRRLLELRLWELRLLRRLRILRLGRPECGYRRTVYRLWFYMHQNKFIIVH